MKKINKPTTGLLHGKYVGAEAEVLQLREQLAAEREAYQVIYREKVEVVGQLTAERENAMSGLRELTHATINRLAKENEQLQQQLAAAQELMAEVRQWHGDKASPDYNECDTAPCQWCESSLKLGTESMDAHVRQKTWELEKQLAAAVEAVNFFASVIKSGEPWTSTCDAVLAKMKGHDHV